MEITNRWYSLKEICEYLGVSRDTIFKWIETKNMPAKRWDVSGNSKLMK